MVAVAGFAAGERESEQNGEQKQPAAPRKLALRGNIMSHMGHQFGT